MDKGEAFVLAICIGTIQMGLGKKPRGFTILCFLRRDWSCRQSCLTLYYV